MDKSPDAFRTISEVADDLDLPQHVLRFWETRFSQIKPLKRGGGRRYYRPDDVDLLKGIRHLLYEEGYTIRGVQRILRDQGNKFVCGIGSGEISITDPLTTAPIAGDAPPDAKDTAPAPSGGSKAVSVGQYTATQQREASEREAGEGGKGFLGRLRGKDGAAAGEAETGAGRLSAEDRRSLQATLYELLECKRLLDQVRSD